MLRRTERLNQFISITNLSLDDHIHTKSPSSSIEWEWGFDRRTIGYLNPPPHPPPPPFPPHSFYIHGHHIFKELWDSSAGN